MLPIFYNPGKLKENVLFQLKLFKYFDEVSSTTFKESYPQC